jgi:cephalosporin-C deacetylase-like acetyl esterase
MKKALLSLLLLLPPLHAATENYPYRGDMLWVTVPDHADWIYRTGERATVEVRLYRYGIPQDGLELTYEIGDDMLPADTSGRVTLKNGKATVDVGTSGKPGFRDLRLTAVVGGKPWKHHIKLAFSPEKIEPFTRMPDDFRDFWERNKAEAARFPLSYTRELAEEYCSDIADCYLVRLALNPSQCVYGYLFIPKDAKPGTCPVVLCPPGAGVKTIKNPQSKPYYAERGCIRFVTEIHGLDPRMSDERFAEISAAFNSGDNGYMQNGLDNRDNYYMKRVYLACVRGIDLLTSLPQWDGKNVFVHGGSQGGALTLVTAALDPRVTACAANHPAISDMGAYSQPGRTGGWPHLNRLNGMLTPEKLRVMAYYDVVNFARLITVPTRMTWGFNDDVCPPTTSYAVWNVLTCPKEALITPINEHWTTEETERGHLRWLLERKR